MGKLEQSEPGLVALAEDLQAIMDYTKIAEGAELPTAAEIFRVAEEEMNFLLDKFLVQRARELRRPATLKDPNVQLAMGTVLEARGRLKKCMDRAIPRSIDLIRQELH